MKKPGSKKSNDADERNDAMQQMEADLLRLQADFANYKRRSEEERLAVSRIAKQQVVIDVLPVLDNIERALAHVPEDLKGNEWAEGVSKVAEQLVNKLTDMGVSKITTIGEEFDPHLHEAIATEGEGTKEIISEELQAGYAMGEEVLRPAMVKVTKQEEN